MDHAPRPLATALHLLLPLLLVLLLLAAVLGALGGSAVWLLRSESGTRWLLARLPGVQAEGVQGALLGERFAAERLQLRWAGGQRSVTLLGVHGEGLRWSWRPGRGAWVGVDAAQLAAREVVVETGPASATRITPPASLELPLHAQTAALQVERLRIDELPPLLGITAEDVSIGGDDGHRVGRLQLDWDRLHLQGRAGIAATKPFALSGQAQITTPGDTVTATLQATGTLTEIELDGTLRGAGAAGRPPPSASVNATLRPFAAWPLAALSGETRALDLSALYSRAPQTRLSGRVRVTSSARDAPIGAAVQLDNALPGRWDEQRLPLRRIVLDLKALAAQPDRLELDEFDVALADAHQDAGRWHGRGQWQGHTLQIDSTLSEVRPQRLDGRAAAMSLSGPLAFTLHGLPTPDPTSAAVPPPLALELRGTLDGKFDALPQAVQISIQAHADAGHLELGQLRAQAGSAVAQAHASLRRLAGGSWQLASAGSLTDFDPLPWWRGEAGSAWRQGPHRLSADWEIDLRVPALARRLAPLALLQSVAGNGTLRVHDSLLAGVPLGLDLALAQAAAGEGAPTRVHGELRLAGNRISIEGRGDPAGAGADDRLQFELDAPSLAALAPLFRLDPDLAAWAPRAGSAQASLGAQGRWPRLSTDGKIRLQQLEAGDLAIATGDANWHFDLAGVAEQPLALQAELAGVQLGRQRAQQLRAELRGTLAEHQLLVSAALPLAPPPIAEQVLGVNALAGTRAQMQAEGSWRPDAGGGGRWRGRIARLAVGAWDGKSLEGQTQSNWVDARDLHAQAQFDARGDLARVQADAGSLKLADTVTLRWDEVDVNLLEAATHVELRADVEPFQVAPLLARLQPTMGWQGDLRLGATVSVHAAEHFDADVVLERRDGDLKISDERGTQQLGLTDLRVALAAHDGNWIFSQALAGTTIGEMAGALGVHTTPQRRWPAADAPVDGVLEAHVANLGIWGSWVPAGWRLSGELHTSASIGGTFGAPEYTGSIHGSGIAVRNLLQGVNVSQGEVAIQLKGAAAQIERFTLKGGDGTIVVTGGAEFGSAPQAQLHLAAEHFRVLGRIDRQLVASGNADLTLGSEKMALEGSFTVDEGLFDTSHGDAPALDDDVSVRRPGAAEEPTDAAPAPKPRANATLTVDVDLGEKLRVRGHGLDTVLRGRLHVTTRGGRPALLGVVTTEGGTYAAYAQKLEIERGIITFTGAVDNPRLDILALRPNSDTRVGVAIDGTLTSPHARLYSETDMSDTDKLSWLLLGRAPDGLGRTDTALLQRAAVALLAGEDEAPTDAILHNLGLDELSLRQSDTDVHETVVSLGKQLSRNWYVGYERGVNSTTGTWQLIYRIAQRFTVRAQSGLENSLDVIWVWKFDELPKPPVPKPAPKPPQ